MRAIRNEIKCKAKDLKRTEIIDFDDPNILQYIECHLNLSDEELRELKSKTSNQG